MSRQLEQFQEERSARREKAIFVAIEYGLEEAVGRAGGVYRGFAYKHGAVEALLIIKADFPAGPQVAFCGAADLGSCLVKAMNAASTDKLRWREDKYGG